jgi:hypothetical protein
MPQPQAAHRDYDLPLEGHRVSLIGPARTLAWPSMCPSCGDPAATPIRVYKIFRRKMRRRPWQYHIRSIDVPYCERCTRQHHELVEPPGAFSGWLAVLRTPLIIPLVGGIIVGAILWDRSLLEAIRDPESGKLALAIAAIPLLAIGSSVVGAWWSFRFHRMPPQTEVTRACDFSDNMGNVFVGERRIFAIRNARFAEAFKTANRDRLWTDEIRARDDRRTGIVAVAGLALLVIAWFVFGRGRS